MLDRSSCFPVSSAELIVCHLDIQRISKEEHIPDWMKRTVALLILSKRHFGSAKKLKIRHIYVLYMTTPHSGCHPYQRVRSILTCVAVLVTGHGAQHTCETSRLLRFLSSLLTDGA